jgi:hypothetical protein
MTIVYPRNAQFFHDNNDKTHLQSANSKLFLQRIVIKLRALGDVCIRKKVVTCCFTALQCLHSTIVSVVCVNKRRKDLSLKKLLYYTAVLCEASFIESQRTKNNLPTGHPFCNFFSGSIYVVLLRQGC